jgi:hypothetical protein
MGSTLNKHLKHIFFVRKRKFFMKTMILISLFLMPHATFCMDETRPTTTGLQGYLYWQSWMKTKKDLLLYAVEHNLFEPDNQEHKKLVTDALNECLSKKDLEAVTNILTIMNEKFPTKRFLNTKTSKKIHHCVTNRQTSQVLATKITLSQAQSQELSDTLQTLSTKVTQSILQLDTLQKKQEAELAVFIDFYKKNKQTLILLHTIDKNLDMQDDSSQNSGYCSDLDDLGNMIEIEAYSNDYFHAKLNNKDNEQALKQSLENLHVIQNNLTQMLTIMTAKQ